MLPKEAMAVLIASFRQDKIEPDSQRIYIEHLKDIPGPVLKQTVSHIVSTSKFFPSIAEIRETAARLCGALPVSPAEALNIVRQADVGEPKYDRAGRYCYTERSWDWPRNVSATTMAAIHRALQGSGDPFNLDGKQKFGWDQGFMKTYEHHAEELKAELLSNLDHLALPAPQRKAVSDGRGNGEKPTGMPKLVSHTGKGAKPV